MDLMIDPELRDFLEDPGQETDEALEQSLLAEGGAREPILVWKGKNVIVDGHRRYRVCRKHGLPFRVEEVEFASKEEAMDKMDEIQRMRRNSSKAERDRLRERRVRRLREQGLGTDAAVKKVASDEGVGGRTVYRSLKRSELIDSLPQDVRSRINGGLAVSDKDLEQLADLGESHQRALLKSVEDGEFRSLHTALNGEPSGNGKSSDNLSETPKAAPESAKPPPPPPSPKAPPASPSPPEGDWRAERSRAVKHGEALMRALDDLNRLQPKDRFHQTALSKISDTLKILKSWS